MTKSASYTRSFCFPATFCSAFCSAFCAFFRIIISVDLIASLSPDFQAQQAFFLVGKGPECIYKDFSFKGP